MNQKLSKGIIVALLFSSLLLVSSLTVQPTAAYVGSTVPPDAVRIWGTNWNNMTLWLCGGTPLATSPIDGVYTVAGDFPALVFNSTEFTADTDYSIYQFGDSGSYPDMWFTVSYSFENLTADNFFSAFLLSGKEGDTQYAIQALADTWATYRNGSSMNMTEITPDPSGVIDVFMHFDSSDGYITTYMDGVMIDNATSLNTSDGVGGFGFQVDSNNHEDDIVVRLSNMGAYVPLEDIPTPTPTPSPTPHSAGPGPMWSGSGSHSSSSDGTPVPVQQISISLHGLEDYSVLIIVIALVVVVLLVIYIRKK
ncbi:Uncharacterised protein [uncultured archaeon]|nr:Uncharacterised protein [uncultured archaeon]